MPRSVSALCSLLGYSRQALYQGQHHQQQEAYAKELLLQQIQIIRTEQKRVGGRKLLLMLNGFMHQHGIIIGRDSFFDLLAEHGLLVRKRKRSKPITTNSYHRYHRYKNIIKDFVPTASNQLWVSDITYITLKQGFAYLSLITDAYSRKVVGYSLHKTLEAAGSVKAARMALQTLPKQHALIHHSDRGVQYCCNDYVKLLHKHAINISMTENGDPLENAVAERVNGILKDELLEDQYSGFTAAQLGIAKAVSIYNHQRLHSSIDYLTPIEAHNKTGVITRRWTNYYTPKTKEEPMADPN